MGSKNGSFVTEKWFNPKQNGPKCKQKEFQIIKLYESFLWAVRINT